MESHVGIQMPQMWSSIYSTHHNIAHFFLTGSSDIDIDWALISSSGLIIDYFKFRLLPASRRKKLLELAKTIAQEKQKMLYDAAGLNALSKIF